MFAPKNIGTERAWQKIRQYCAYQERNHREAKEKLYSFGLYKDEVSELLARLIEENFLNEERYAIAFAGGKFRMKGWGKIKIKQALRQQQVSEYCINLALKAIDDDDYAKKLELVAAQKEKLLQSEKNALLRRKKLTTFLLQRGFEAGRINDYLSPD